MSNTCSPHCSITSDYPNQCECILIFRSREYNSRSMHSHPHPLTFKHVHANASSCLMLQASSCVCIHLTQTKRVAELLLEMPLGPPHPVEAGYPIARTQPSQICKPFYLRYGSLAAHTIGHDHLIRLCLDRREHTRDGGMVHWLVKALAATIRMLRS